MRAALGILALLAVATVAAADPPANAVFERKGMLLVAHAEGTPACLLPVAVDSDCFELPPFDGTDLTFAVGGNALASGRGLREPATVQACLFDAAGDPLGCSGYGGAETAYPEDARAGIVVASSVPSAGIGYVFRVLRSFPDPAP